MKLKDYEIPKDGMDDVLDAAELQKYNLKNFDLSQLEPDPIFTSAPQVVAAPVNEPAIAEPDPIPRPAVAITAPPPSALEQELGLNIAAQDSPWSDGFALGGGPGSAHDDLSHFAMNLGDVPACVELPVTGLAYNPFSLPQQSSTLPRWILVSMGGFFVSAAALAITFCVVLLRPSVVPAAQAPAPAALVTAPANAVSAPEVRTSAPAAANVKQVAPVVAQPVVVSHQPKFVRRQAHRARRTIAAAPDQTATPKSRPPQDDLDRLLGEASP